MNAEILETIRARLLGFGMRLSVRQPVCPDERWDTCLSVGMNAEISETMNAEISETIRARLYERWDLGNYRR